MSKLTELKAKLAEARKLADEAAAEAVQVGNHHLVALRGRLSGAVEMLTAHEAHVEANPLPAAKTESGQVGKPVSGSPKA